MNKNYRVSVIVTTYNASRWVSNVLNSLLAQTYPTEKIEIIVVDDGSIDETSTLVKNLATSHHQIHLIKQANQGTAGALTTGLTNATGEIIALLSHDCYATPEWISNVVDIFTTNHGIGIVQGMILPEKPIDIPFYHCTTVYQPSRSFEGACVAYRSEAVDKAGRYFDKTLSRYGDDADMAWRIIEKGYQAKWIAKSTAYHAVVPKPFSIRRAIRDAWGSQVFPLLFKRHPQLRQKLWFGTLLGDKYRYLRLLAVFVSIIMVLVGLFPLAICILIAIIVTTWMQVLKRNQSYQIKFFDKFILIPIDILIHEWVGFIALFIGSVKYRCLIM